MKIIRPILTIAILALIVYGVYTWLIIPFLMNDNAKVVHMVDPDTYIVMRGRTLSKVQLIGVDAPENYGPGELKYRECYGDEALKQTSEFFSKNRDVVLEGDEGVGEKDLHGRELKYITMSDGTLLNERLIKDGLAKVYVPDNLSYKHKDRFIEVETEARNEKTGIWGKDKCVKS